MFESCVLFEISFCTRGIVHWSAKFEFPLLFNSVVKKYYKKYLM